MGKPIFWLLGASLLFNAFLLGVNFQNVSGVVGTFANDIVAKYNAHRSEKALKEFDELIKNSPIVCRHPLTNAMLLHSSSLRQYQTSTPACMASKMGHSIEIKNGSNAHAIVKIKSIVMNQTYISFLVRKGESVRESCIPDGPFKVQFGFGENLNEQCNSFIKLHGTQEFRDVINLQTRKTNRSTSWQQISFTLYPVPDGNAPTESISAASFAAD